MPNKPTPKPETVLSGEIRTALTERLAVKTAAVKNDERLETLLDAALEERIAHEAITLVHELRPIKPVRIDLLPTILTALPEARKDLMTPELRQLIEHPPTLNGHATEATDGRRVPVVLGVVHDDKGGTRAGVEVVLQTTDGVMLDRTKSNAGGLVVLRFPMRGEGEGAVAGEVKVMGGNTTVNVGVPAGVQHVVTDFALDDLPDLADGIDPATLLGDDPFSRLPTDFTPDLAEAISRLQGTVPDPILGGVAKAGDFRGRRTPLIKRMTIPRLGEVADDATKAPNRYLVRVRQEWTFLGYTLGELSGVEALDPGAVLNEVTSTVESVRRTSSNAVDEVRTLVDNITRTAMSQLSSIDSVIGVATQASTSVTASGFGSLGVSGGIGGGIFGAIAGAALGPIGGLLGIGGGGVAGGVGIGGEIGTRTGTSALTSTTTTNKTATSLHVSSLLHTAVSTVNQAVRTASTTATDLTRRASESVEHVSPLLSRVTNLLRWTLYENYAVTTHVEDVLEIRSVKITADRPQGVPLFTDEDIVEYRRYFQPALLEPRLAPNFDTLAAAVAERLGGGRPISTVNFAIDYSAAVFGADLRVEVGNAQVNLRLEPGSTTARGSMWIAPVKANEMGDAVLTLTARPPQYSGMRLFRDALERYLDTGAVTVSRIRFWYGGSTATEHDQSEWLGQTLHVINDSRVDTRNVDLRPRARSADTVNDPLFRHVNRNATYYFGVLAEAAMSVPALRDDAPELADFRGDHPIWRLPIVGFEGDRVLVISDPKEDDKDAARLLADTGSATIMQLAAPGAYAEALQGLLTLDLVPGELHPSLLPPLPPAMPPLALVDLTGKALEVVDDGGVTTPTA